MAIRLDRISIPPASSESIFPSFSSMWSSISRVGNAALNAISNIGSLFQQEEDLFCGIARLESVEIGPPTEEEKQLADFTKNNTIRNQRVKSEDQPAPIMQLLKPLTKAVRFSEHCNEIFFKKPISEETINQACLQLHTIPKKSSFKKNLSMSDVD